MASGSMGDASVFHGTPSLMVEQLESQSRWKTLPRNLKIAAGIILSGGKSEKIAAYASSLPPGDNFRNILTKFMVNVLWGSLLHPPLTFVGERHQYRSADGSGNSTLFPDLGKAGLPYAKTVPALEPKIGAKPDPGDLFDMLMAREDGENAKVSDLGISSQLVYHADLIIHDIFRTNNFDRNISDTSSYLDLAPLYGKNREAQETIRTMKDGLLKPDSFAEERLLNQPPGVTVYLIMYSRYHNYVARQLKEINEGGRFSRRPRPAVWTPPADKDAAKDAANKDKKSDVDLDKAWEDFMTKKIDEDLFQTARLVTCGLYINIAIHDYLRVLMRKHAERTDWSLDPRLDMSWLTNKKGVERGIGNTVTSEFNALYRFHSPLSLRDTKWTKEFLQAHVPDEYKPTGTNANKLTQEDYDDAVINLAVMREMLQKIQEDNGTAEQKKASPYVPKREEVHAGWKRDPKTHLFDDKTLVKEICETMEDPLCQFGARNTPKFFRSIEILGILQMRKWELASLNEFRQFFGLKRHKTFESINTDPLIQDRLRTLYGHPDMVEFHPGLWCEGQNRCLDPGASCPNGEGTALWRGVFSDAVTLVRSDRFYTLDWNVGSLTGWGMSEVSSDVNIFKGGVMGRLYQRAFPGYFKCDSIHLWQPFYTPAMNILVADDQDLLKELQPISEIGVDNKLWTFVKSFKGRNDLLYLPLDTVVERINQKFVEMRREDLKIQHADVLDLQGIQDDIWAGYNGLSFAKKIIKGKPDGTGLWRKLQFHMLRRAAKMQKFEKATVPTPVSNIEMIKSILYEYKDQFKNPGYADSTAFRDFDPSWLEECLRGERVAPRDGKKAPMRGGNGDLQDKGLQLMQELVSDGKAVYPSYYVAHSFKDHTKQIHKAPRNQVHKLVERSIEELFYDYFFFMAHRIRHREQLKFQSRDRSTDPKANGVKQTNLSGHVLQIDIVKDYAIPVIVRFLADFLGFGHMIKNQTFPKRKYDENELYEHFINCQDYLTFDADETRAFRRRKAFQKSLAFLKKLTEEGVQDAQRMWFESIRGRTYHIDDGDNDLVRELRKFGVESAQRLTKYFSKERYEKPQEAAAAVMLSAALEASHKSVHIFTQVMDCLLGSYKVGGNDVRHFWPKIQELSFSQDPKDKYKLMRYVLEAQRANVNIPLVRRFVPDKKAVGTRQVPSQCRLDGASTAKLETLEERKEYLLEIHKAYTHQDPPRADNAPPTFDLNRPASEYLIYGREKDGPFNAKQLTIIAITALVQYAGTFSNLREAHGVMGRVKTAKSPEVKQAVLDDYRDRYLTVKWDQLVPYPTSWNLRYDGIGEGTAPGHDNSKTGNDTQMVRW